MAMEQPFDWRQYDRKLFAAAAIVFPAVLLLGFARTYYLRFAFSAPPIPSTLVHVHGALMTAWVVFFVGQVFFIRTKNHKTHMKLGVVGVALATLMIIVGFFTATAAAKYGSPSTPPGVAPMAFMVVPLVDMLMFAGLFGAAIYYRKSPADHKRLMLLTAINFLPPGLGRIPFEPFVSGGILVFLGIPTVLALGLVAFDTWKNGKLNKVFLVASLLLVASYPLRIIISGTGAWMTFATWLTSWSA